MNQKGPARVIILSIITVSLLVIVIGLFAYLGSSDAVGKDTQTKSAAPFNFEVVYAGDGFAPGTLEVPLGSRVAFTNTSDNLLHTASDPYVTHTDYPEFDANKEYPKGGRYIFQFNKAGTFGYHNANHLADHGVIRVIDPAAHLPDIDKTKLGQRAVRDKLLAMLDANDANSIFAVVDFTQADPALALDCHDVGHDIGHRAYELYGFSGAMAFDNPNHLKHALVQYICAGGYMHGIVEQLFLHQPAFKTQPDLVCASVPDADRESCYHGIGHAMMYSENRIASLALLDCRNIAHTKDMYRCFEGTWMELFWGNSDGSSQSTLGWSPEKPLVPCIDAATDEKPTCFLYASFGYLRMHAKDYPGAVHMCTTNNLPEVDAGFCLKGLGITMMSKFKGKHLEGSEVYVDGLTLNDKKAFYQGVMGYAKLSGVEKSDLESSCRSFKNDTDICLAVLGVGE